MEIYKGIALGHCDHEDLIDFLNYVFTMNGHDRGFYRLLPKLYRPDRLPEQYQHVVTEDGKLRGAVGAFPIEIEVMGESLTAAGIGNVAVHPFHRGKGYMKDCMKMAMDNAVKEGKDFAVLGGRRQRYAYFGFESAGVCAKFDLDGTNLRHCFGSPANTTGYTVKQLKETDEADIAAIEALVRSRPSHPVRPADRVFDIMRSWESKVCAIYDDKGEFAGYFLCNGEGTTVHELDCVSADKMEGCVRAMHDFCGAEGQHITIPLYLGELYDFLTGLCESYNIGHSENTCVLHYEKVLRACLRLRCATDALCDGSFTALIHGIAGDEKLRIAVENGEAIVEKFDGECDLELSHLEAMRTFFSLHSPQKKQLPAACAAWFPLHLYVPEIDND